MIDKFDYLMSRNFNNFPKMITFDDYRVFKDSYNTFLNSKYYLKDFFKEKKINEYLNLTSYLSPSFVSISTFI